VTIKPKPLSRPWWNYVRFSLRALIVLVLLIGLCLGWLVRSAQVQRDAVAAIKKAGGSVRYDWDWSGGVIMGGKPWAPKWIVDLIGADYFGHVATVTLTAKATDATLAHVGRLTRLDALFARSSSVSDTALVHLKALTNLSQLDLGSSQVTDAGLVHLKGLTKLSLVWLRGTHVTDAGVVDLKALTTLAYLELNGTHVTDAGLAHLKGLTKLSILEVYDTEVTDAGIDELRRALPTLAIGH
jgi:hypothetical protein